MGLGVYVSQPKVKYLVTGLHYLRTLHTVITR